MTIFAVAFAYFVLSARAQDHHHPPIHALHTMLELPRFDRGHAPQGYPRTCNRRASAATSPQFRVTVAASPLKTDSDFRDRGRKLPLSATRGWHFVAWFVN
jgi:hypothetical protein